MSVQTKRRNKFIQIKGGRSLPTAKKNKCRKKSLSSKQKSHGIYKNITFLREQDDRSRMRKIFEANRTMKNGYYTIRIIGGLEEKAKRMSLHKANRDKNR